MSEEDTMFFSESIKTGQMRRDLKSKDQQITQLQELLQEARNALEDGIETEGPTEAEHSIHARNLVSRIDAVFMGRPNDD